MAKTHDEDVYTYCTDTYTDDKKLFYGTFEEFLTIHPKRRELFNICYRWWLSLNCWEDGYKNAKAGASVTRNPWNSSYWQHREWLRGFGDFKG